MPYPQLIKIFLLCSNVLLLAYQLAGVSVFEAAEKNVEQVREAVLNTIVIDDLWNVGSADDCATACRSTVGCSASWIYTCWNDGICECMLLGSGRTKPLVFSHDEMLDE